MPALTDPFPSVCTFKLEVPQTFATPRSLTLTFQALNLVHTSVNNSLHEMARTLADKMVQFQIPFSSSLQLKNISHEFLTDLGLLQIYHIESQFFRATCITTQMNISMKCSFDIYFIEKSIY